MTRFMLIGLAVLLGLILLDRESRPAPTIERVSAPAHRSPGQAAAPASALVRSAVAADTGTPLSDWLARVESRRLLEGARTTTYFDSLLTETDSLIRRWPQPETPILVAVRADSTTPTPGLVELTQTALSTWENLGIGVRFELIEDTLSAQIRVATVPQLEGSRIGETHLLWAPNGAIRSAEVVLALHDSTGAPLPVPVVRTTATHEIGHALGLSHSGNPEDVMFPWTRQSSLSPRDIATITLLYQLPLGSVRGATKP